MFCYTFAWQLLQINFMTPAKKKKKRPFISWFLSLLTALPTTTTPGTPASYMGTFSSKLHRNSLNNNEVVAEVPPHTHSNLKLMADKLF